MPKNGRGIAHSDVYTHLFVVFPPVVDVLLVVVVVIGVLHVCDVLQCAMMTSREALNLQDQSQVRCWQY